MRVGILGAGGLGLVLGAGLACSGTDVVLVGRPGHVDAIRERGLEIDGISGHHIVSEHLEAVTNVDEIEGYLDYLIVVVKAAAMDAALADAVRIKDRIGAVLSLQNTVVKDELLVKAFGAELVIGASTIEGGTLEGPGRVRHTATCPTTAYFGELDGSISPRIDALVAAFCAGGFASVGTHAIHQVEWEKLMQIGVVAGFSVSALAAVPRARFADGIALRCGAELYVGLASELLQVYSAMGFEPQDFFAPFSKFKAIATQTFDEAVAEQMELGRSMKAAGMGGRASMHEDVLNGRRTEVDYILGPYVAEATSRGMAVPTLTAVHRIANTINLLLADGA